MQSSGNHIKRIRLALWCYSFQFHLAVVSLAKSLGDFNQKNMSVTQKMFASSGVMFIAVFMFTQAIPVPMPEQSIQPGSFFLLQHTTKLKQQIIQIYCFWLKCQFFTKTYYLLYTIVCTLVLFCWPLYDICSFVLLRF